MPSRMRDEALQLGDVIRRRLGPPCHTDPSACGGAICGVASSLPWTNGSKSDEAPEENTSLIPKAKVMTHASIVLRGRVAGDEVVTGDEHRERCNLMREAMIPGAINPKLESPREQLWRWLNDAAHETIERPPAGNLDAAVGQLLLAARKEGAIELGNAVMMLYSLHRIGAAGLACRALFGFAAELFTEGHAKLVIDRQPIVPEAEIEQLRQEWMKILP